MEDSTLRPLAHAQYMFEHQGEHTPAHQNEGSHPERFGDYLHLEHHPNSEPPRQHQHQQYIEAQTVIPLRTVFHPNMAHIRIDEAENGVKPNCQRNLDFFDYEM